MKKRIGTLLTLLSAALVTSVISFSFLKSNNLENCDAVAIDVPESDSNPIFYPANYSKDIVNEPYYSEQKTKTFDDMGFKYAPNFYRGENVKVAIIDSGINYDHEDFPTINGDSRTIDNLSGSWAYYSFSSNEDRINDTLGHGTNVASVVASQINSLGCAGIAPNIDLYIYKVTNTVNGYEWYAINSALEYCISAGIDVINMSFQAYEKEVKYNGSTMGPSSGCSTVLSYNLNRCYNAGITLVAAAGNYNTAEPSYPASNSNVISVGSFAQNDKNTKASFSNTYGIDLVAPGYVRTAEKGSSNSYTTTSGTSFSAPIVTAAIALYKQKNPTATPSQIETALYASCDPIDDGDTNWAGHGALNVDKFLGLDENSPTSVTFTNPSDGELTLNVGDTFQLENSVLPSTFDGGFEYSLEENNGVLSVSNTGEITALSEGVEMVTVNPVGYKTISDSIYVTVNDVVEDPYKSVAFKGINASGSVQSYNSSVSYTDNGFTVKTEKFNNNNKGWDFIRCGDKNNASIATIDTVTAIDKPINNIAIAFDTVSTTYLNSAKVITSTNSNFTSDIEEYTFTPVEKSTIVVPITNSDESLYYRISFDQNKTSSNGTIAVKKVDYNVNEYVEQYIVSFDANGGSGEMDNSTTSGTTYIAPLCNFTKIDYTFDGWALNSSGGTKYNVGDVITSISTDITLYATWKEGSSPTPGPTNDYYKGVTATSGTSLLGQLHDLMGKTHSTYTTYTDCKDPNKVYSTDPGSSGSYVTEFYSQSDIGSAWDGNHVGTWNREHVWCQSQSIYGSSGKQLWGETYGGSDLHHLRPVECSLNSTRNNHPFGVVPTHNSTTARYPKDTSGNYTSHQGGWFQSGYDKFEPIDEVKGDVARILMYVFMHYSNQTTGTDYGDLVGHTGDIQITNIVAPSSGSGDQACWNLLLEWNAADPVSESERVRNEAAYKLQGNRNPFIDNDKYADAIWGNKPIVVKSLDSIELSGNQQTTFSVGDTFNYDGLVVTAHYNGAENSVVTPTSVIAPDMSIAGKDQVVTVKYEEDGIEKTATYTIDVNPVLATSITLNKTEATVKIGNTETLSVTTWNPTNVTDKTLTWSSSDDSVATVNDGVVTAHKQGSATITAKTTNNIEATCTVTVPAAVVDNVSLDIDSKVVRFTTGASTNTFTITATLVAETGAVVTWTSSDESVIKQVNNGGASAAAASTINVEATFEVLKTGTATITASAGDKTATCDVRATLPLKSYRVDTATTQVPFNGSTTTITGDIYEVYTDDSEAIVQENANLTVDSSSLGNKNASVSYDGQTLTTASIIKVTNAGSGETITESDASKQAEAWAIFFIAMTRTEQTCLAKNDNDKLTGLKAVWGELSTEYVNMIGASKDAFCSTSASSKIKEALQHYQFIISKFNDLTDFVVDGSGSKPASSSNRYSLTNIFSSDSGVPMITIFTVIGIVSILVFVIIKRRRLN